MTDETRDKAANDAKTVQFWTKQIQEQEGVFKSFHARGDSIIKRYRDDDRSKTSASQSRHNILYSNTETLKPVLYSRTPQPEVRATTSKRKDTAVRQAALVLENSLDYSNQTEDFDSLMKRCIEDYLLPGQGVARVKYEPVITTTKGQAESEEGKEEDEEEVIFEAVCSEYVNWKDYLVGPCSIWENRPWEAFRAEMTRQEGLDMFGSIFHDVQMDVSTTGKVDNNIISDDFGRATVWEIWDKEKRQQIFIAIGLKDRPLEVNSDPLNLEQFYSSVKPLYSVTTTSSVIPIPFFVMYQDQAQELDEISTRIRRLIKELKYKGIYDASIKELNSLYNGVDNDWVGVKDLQRVTAAGGLNAAKQVEDITPIANTVISLYQQRDQIKQQIFEIVGVSDIQRAQTDPRETLGAQELKSSFGTLRVSDYQRDVQRFAKDIMNLKAEIIAEKFSASTIAEIGGVEDIKFDRPDGTKGEIDAETYVREVVLPIVRPQEPRQVAIDIETDSTINVNEQAQQQEVIEFTGVLSQLMQVAEPMEQVYGIDVSSDVLMSTLKRFKLSRGLEDKIEQNLEKRAIEKQQALANQGPTPEQIDMQMKQAELELEKQKLETNTQIEIAKLQIKQQENTIKAEELGIRADIEQQKVDLEGLDLALKNKSIDLEAEEKGNQVAESTIFN